MELFTIFIGLLIAIGFTIATTILASRKGRNAVNWFLLSLFWSFVGLIILACSKRLEEDESDTLSKVLWVIIFVPIFLIGIFFYNKSVERQKIQSQQSTEIPVPNLEFSDSYIEKKVDLNDYLNSKTGWDEETDWNATSLDDDETQKAFDKVLKENGIYWSDKKQSWVVKVKSLTEEAPAIEF
ncbi:MAG: hypothetical protein Q8914_01750 [Bacteroidota bacterium]|nr:hypothetical protein [Bacteroidota bacterium]